ncbi:MAG: glycosyltransferase family 2 protein [Pseudomonadota bacterium]
MTNPEKPPISAYIRTKNEARLVAEVVKAALQVVREVVVIDSGSTDDTIALAEAAGAKIVRQEWVGYGHQKRVAEEICENNWLLDLDADEIVTPALAEEIRGLFKNGEPPFPVYKTPMAVMPPIGEPWLEFGLQRRTKFYDKRKIRMPADLFWDQFVIPPGMQLGKFKEPINHYALGDAHHLMTKLNKYSTDRAETAKPRPTGVIILRIIFGLPIYFMRRYLFEGLFRGGVYGFAYALMTSFRRWLVDVKMYEIRKREERSVEKPA